MNEDFLVEHTIGSILRSSVMIYGRHFATFFLICAVPMVPLYFLEGWAVEDANEILQFLAVIVRVIASLFVYGAIVVAVSDVCLGNQPSIRRAYGRIFSTVAARLLWTNILQTLAFSLGLLLLIVPGLVALVWLMLASPVVVLERVSGMAALKRSKQLGDGSHWRNAVLFLLIIICAFVASLVLGLILGFISGYILGEYAQNVAILNATSSLIEYGLVQPLLVTAFVLLYYDRRVRKEGYNLGMLAEDLAR